MDAFWRDVRDAARPLLKRPGFAFMAVGTLGLGVGATTTMFSAVNSVLLRELPYRGDTDIVVVRQTDIRDGSLLRGASAANMRDVGAAARSLSHVAVANGYGFTLMEDGRASNLRGWVVSEEFFEAMGVQPALGRTFLPEEFAPGGPPVVVLGHTTWQTRFGGDIEVVGRSLVLEGTTHTVVGVLPPTFKYPSGAAIWAPRQPQPWDDDLRGGAPFYAVARLADGASLRDARGELDRIAEELARVYPLTNASTGFHVTSLRDHLLGPVESPLKLLLGAVGLVLLIAVANVAGLQLARGLARSREYALRGALGASPRRVLGLVVGEALWLGGLGAGLGIVLAHLGVLAVQRLGPGHLPRIDEISVDETVLGFAVSIALVSALGAAVVPALQASRTAVSSALSDASRGNTLGRSTSGLRDHLVTAEIALALILSIGAGLLIQSFDRLIDNQLGFDPEGRLAIQVFSYDETDQPDLEFLAAAREEIGALPGVEAVGATTALPFADNESIWAMAGSVSFGLSGDPELGAETDANARLVAIDGGYPTSMAVPVLSGRAFDEGDRVGASPVVLVNESLARRYFPERDAIGARVVLGRGADAPREIVGVLADVRTRGFDSEPEPEIYVPLFQDPTTGGITFVVAASHPPVELLSSVQEAIWAVDPGQPVWSARPISELLADWNRERSFNTLLLVAFAGLALALAAVGIFGLMAFSVEQRVRELGVRRALGGGAADVLELVLRRALVLSLRGVALGILGSLLLTGLLEGMLYGITPFDPITFVIIAIFVVAVGTFAALVPAHRATRVSPAVALESS